jgi:hypothetical protein
MDPPQQFPFRTLPGWFMPEPGGHPATPSWGLVRPLGRWRGSGDATISAGVYAWYPLPGGRHR